MTTAVFPQASQAKDPSSVDLQPGSVEQGPPLVRWFDEIAKRDTPSVGGKGANLGEMTQAGLPVPPGFVVTVEAYRRFYEGSGLAADITARIAQLNVDDPDRLRADAEAIQRLIRHAPVPDDVRSSIIAGYERLTSLAGASGIVAVRSSATVEDSAQFSFAGMFESFLNVRGRDAVVSRVKDCWASGFGARVLFYRLKQRLPAEFPLGVVVQRMVDSEKSGVIFTVDPARNDASRLVIEAVWGLGETIVGGQVTPDHYEVDKKSREVLSVAVPRKEFMLTRDTRAWETVRVNLDEARGSAQVLTTDELGALADLAIRDEAHYGIPQDAEFAIEDGRIYIVQTRPVTTFVEKGRSAPIEATRVLVHGLGASPGNATGRVRVLASPSDEGKLKPGEVLVTTMTSPDWVPIMRRAAAIITDAGGMTSHAAIVSRELGIPCIVGARTATSELRDGMIVTIDARAGTVMAGPPPNASASPGTRDSGDVVGSGDVVRSSSAAVVSSPAPIITATRIYVNLAEPDLAERVAAQDVDGVGLLRAEFMLLSALDKTHPRKLLLDGRGAEIVGRMAESLEKIASAFAPRPVVYRSMDFRSNEFRGLAGGDAFEPHEENPMIGYRGCFRYTREPDLFAVELQALKQVRPQFPNLHLMIPFVRTGSEFRTCKRLVDESGLTGDPSFQLWVMAEVPSVVSWLEEYVRLGVTGVSIGSNDLTQLVLGVDRDSTVLATLYDERDKAVQDTIRSIIAECKRLGVTCSICGQAPSVHPDYAELLVRWGIDSISVTADAIDRTRRNVAAAERKLLLAAARGRLAESTVPFKSGV